MAQRPRTFKFEGITMSHYFTDNWEKVKNFKAKPDDVVIATYPKAGTTWMCEILDQLYFGEMRKEGSLSPLYERVPFLEVCIEELSKGTDQIESLTTSPRLIKTHLPVQLVPQSFWEQNCRMIYVARNPKDSMVSYYHFERMNKIQPDPGAWEEYIHKFNTGELVFGSWYDHVQGWWDKSKSYSRIHYVFFEDMKEDAAREISRLCSFLGLSPAETQKQEVLRKTGFDEMKKNFADEISKIKIFDESISPFMRKGAVGDWKNHFTAAQNEAFDEEYRKKMKNSDLKFRMEI
ncbi:cytosolic sulfotransferase 1-like isoform X2 [Scleropages formosus]|uniref:Sulfotransferase n=1 Tax=Scleropages formosus TaxID=113540 RepID=A0A8C9U2A9_SCLFO|nr:cytosolic sulfotransferase 1-like isoform X2 [Scleropages formosus]